MMCPNLENYLRLILEFYIAGFTFSDFGKLPKFLDSSRANAIVPALSVNAIKEQLEHMKIFVKCITGS